MDENTVNGTVAGLSEQELAQVSGGSDGLQMRAHVQIIGCKHSCNVRSSPSSGSDANKIGVANLGDRYRFYHWQGSWAKVQYGNRIGYIYKRFIRVL